VFCSPFAGRLVAEIAPGLFATSTALDADGSLLMGCFSVISRLTLAPNLFVVAILDCRTVSLNNWDAFVNAEKAELSSGLLK
jgi:hypothetical protein